MNYSLKKRRQNLQIATAGDLGVPFAFTSFSITNTLLYGDPHLTPGRILSADAKRTLNINKIRNIGFY